MNKKWKGHERERERNERKTENTEIFIWYKYPGLITSDIIIFQ